MANLNRIILIGRLTADPETRSTLDGLPMSKFSLAVDRPVGASGKKESDFFDIIAWGKLAEICGSYLVKGQLVLIEGKIQNRTYETKDGAKRYATEIIARSMKMLERGKGKPAETGGNTTATVPDSDEDLIDDDLPF
ncbi:MAG: single-stranded DNA-binding protein [Candidatus Margulisiibacteriota bacterium]